MTETGVGSLETEALKRKERLEALKRKAQGENGEKAVKVFRNYRPEVSPEDAESEEKISLSVEMDVVDNEVKEQLEAMKKPMVVEEIDISNLAPRKPDWDLKRDVAKKMEILEKRTQRAIAELIRDRLKDGKMNISSAVNVGAAEHAREEGD